MLGIDYVHSNFKMYKNVPLSRTSCKSSWKNSSINKDLNHNTIVAKMCMIGNTELTWEVQEMLSSEDMLIKTRRLKRNQQEGAFQENRDVRGSQQSPGKRPGRPAAEQMAIGAEQRESMWSMSAIESKHLVTNSDGGMGR